MPGTPYLDPYRRAFDHFGSDFEVTLWASRDTQCHRFDVMSRMLDLGGLRVLDAGCSRGDFAAFMLESGIEYESYVGIDGLQDVIDYAASRRDLPRASFQCGDILQNDALLRVGDPHVICISGTLNTMTMRQVLGLLDSAWSTATEALMFNFLSDLATRRAAPQTGPARRHSAARLLQWATKQTGLVQYRQDYLRYGHDATILMRKDPSST